MKWHIQIWSNELMLGVILIFFSSVAPLRAQQKIITTSDGVDLYLEIKGEGPPCLYIHGGPGAGSYWLDKFYGDYLEKHFTMIYLDQRGVGRSDSSMKQDYSLDRIVADFEEVREALGIREWYTLGHSFGGILQMGYTKRNPDKLSGLIMINCSLDLRETMCSSWLPEANRLLKNSNNFICPEEPKQIMSVFNKTIKKLRERDLLWRMTFKQRENDSILNASYQEISNWNHDFGSVALDNKEFWRNFKKSTVDIDIPVLFFYGKNDITVGTKHFQNVNFPMLIRWPCNVGHIPFLEKPKDFENALEFYLKFIEINEVSNGYSLKTK